MKVIELFDKFQQLQGVKELVEQEDGSKTVVENGIATLKGKTLPYALMKNIKKMDHYLNQYRYEVTPRMHDYQRLRRTLIMKQQMELMESKKNTEFVSTVSIELAKLEKDYEQDKINMRKDIEAKRKRLEEEESTFEFHKVKLSDRLISRKDVFKILDSIMSAPSFSFENLKEAVKEINELDSFPADLPEMTAEQMAIIDCMLDDVE